MNTSKSRRILLSWLFVVFLFSMIGMVIGFSISTRNETDDTETEAETSAKILIYGTPDGKIYEGGFYESYEVENDFVFSTEIPVTFGEDLQEFTYYLSAAYGIDYSLVLAIISKESNFMPDGISSTDDYGLMQIPVV